MLDATDRRDAEETARRATARAALLAQVSAELTGELDTVSALGRLAQLVVPVLTDGCIVTVVDRDGRARDVGSWHADAARRPLMQRYTLVRLESLPSASPVAQALQTGTPVTQPVDAVLPLMRPGPSRDLLVALDPATAVVLPLTADGHTVGVLTLYLDAGRGLSEADLETAREVAAEAGRAVARVHRQSQQAQLAEVLQRSLLTEPPALGEAQIVARYLPAAEAARVGGDWYDAFPQRDGRAVLVIGDVVGHDTVAAAAMGQLRACCAASPTTAGPDRLTSCAAWTRPSRTCTPTPSPPRRSPGSNRRAPTTVQLSALGQRRPSAADHRRARRAFDGARRPRRRLMLGVDCTARRPESVVDVPAGSTVLLYTDGLIERRGSSIDEGIDRLVLHLRELAGARPRRVLRRPPRSDGPGHTPGRRRDRRRPARAIPEPRRVTRGPRHG